MEKHKMKPNNKEQEKPKPTIEQVSNKEKQNKKGNETPTPMPRRITTMPMQRQEIPVKQEQIKKFLIKQNEQEQRKQEHKQEKQEINQPREQQVTKQAGKEQEMTTRITNIQRTRTKTRTPKRLNTNPKTCNKNKGGPKVKALQLNEGLTTLKQFLESKAKARQGGGILGENKQTTHPPTTPEAAPSHTNLEREDDTGSEKRKGPT